MELQETFDRFLADMKLEGKADMTLVEYANRLSRFKKYLIRHKKALNEVKHDDIVEFSREMLKFGLKTTTLKCELSTIYVYSLWAVKNGILDHVFLSPADYPKTNTAKKRIRRLSDENIRAFIAYIDSLQENIRAAFWLMYGTGARVGEIAHLMATDVQLRERAVYINIRDAKWGSDRCVQLLTSKRPRLCGSISNLLDQVNSHCFGYHEGPCNGMRQNLPRRLASSFIAIYYVTLLRPD